MEATMTALTTGITEIATNMGNAISEIIPVSLPIVGMILVVTIGLRVFKKITGK